MNEGLLKRHQNTGSTSEKSQDNGFREEDLLCIRLLDVTSALCIRWVGTTHRQDVAPVQATNDGLTEAYRRQDIEIEELKRALGLNEAWAMSRSDLKTFVHASSGIMSTSMTMLTKVLTSGVIQSFPISTHHNH